MRTVIANREDFFPRSSCPITLRAIQSGMAKSHEGDLTDIRHTHDFAELIIITHGGGTHWIDGEVYEVSAGDVFLIQGNTEHYFTRRHQLEMYNIMFDDLYLRDYLQNLRSLPGFNAFFLFEPTYRKRHKFQSHLHLDPESLFPLISQLRQMADECRREKLGFDLILLAKVLEIFVMISREYERSPHPMIRSLFRLGQIITKLENDYAEDWNIAKISRIASLSPSTLLPVFKEVTGVSPIEYLLRVRLTRAAERLLHSSQSISEIAHACGFGDSNYFSRQFRRHYSLSPREYRQLQQ